MSISLWFLAHSNHSHQTKSSQNSQRSKSSSHFAKPLNLRYYKVRGPYTRWVTTGAWFSFSYNSVFTDGLTAPCKSSYYLLEKPYLYSCRKEPKLLHVNNSLTILLTIKWIKMEDSGIFLTLTGWEDKRHSSGGISGCWGFAGKPLWGLPLSSSCKSSPMHRQA